MSIRRSLGLCAALLSSLPVAAAHAQSGARDSQARVMIRQAMEDYQNLEVDGAIRNLHLALNMCSARSSCSPAMLARVHLSLGIVSVGGQSDAATGTNEFAEALRLDPASEPDPTLVTPEITAAFNDARSRTGGRGNSTATPPPVRNPEPPPVVEPPVRTPAAVAALLHTPSPEQLENTPLPVYVEVPAALGATRVVVHYRGLGMSGYSDVPMTRMAAGYGVEIPCGQVIRPRVEYYVTADDASGNHVGALGSAEAPTRVNIVGTRSQPAPALPGRMPAETCMECPPGMSGPQCNNGGGGGRGMRGMGDPCERDQQCADGLRCDAGSCAPGGSSNSGGGSETPGTERLTQLFALEVGGGFGLNFLGTNPAMISSVNDPQYPDAVYGDADANGVQSIQRSDGISCAPGSLYSCPSYDAANNGAAPTLAGFLFFNARVSPFTAPILRRFALSVFMRYQPTASDALIGEDMHAQLLAHFLIGGRLMFAVLGDGFVRNGFILAPFVGFAGGQAQATAPQIPNMDLQYASISNGPNDFQGGVRVEYGFAKYIHIGFEPVFHYMFPRSMFVMDLNLVAGFHY